MRGPGDSKVSTLTVLKCFSEEENPAEEPDTQVSKRHLITPFRDINADNKCFFLETFHRLTMPTNVGRVVVNCTDSYQILYDFCTRFVRDGFWNTIFNES